MPKWSIWTTALLIFPSDHVVPLTLDRRKLLASIIGLPSFLSANTPALAACMAGDLSPECIGVYKLPENAVSTEDMKRFAPDIKIVKPLFVPKSTVEALELLETQRLAAKDIMEVVQAGRLEEAGIKLLNSIPKVVLSARRIVEDAKERIPETHGDVRTLRELQLDESFQILEASWKSADVTIGQGLRGDLGVSAVAQIRILSDLRDAITSLDDFLVVSKSRK